MNDLNLLLDLRDRVKLSHIFFLACGLALVKIVSHLYQLARKWSSPLRHLPGPDMDSWIFGHSYTLLQDQNTTIWERWAERYGSTMRLRGYCGVGFDLPYN